LGTATSLHNGGPLGLLLGYITMGTICYAVMVSTPSSSSFEMHLSSFPQVSLGEMIAYLPIEGGHIKLAERFVDPAFSFAMGWNYWYNWVIVLPAELSAAAVLISYWNKVINPAAWVSMCLVVVVSINLLGAGNAVTPLE
jgi:amino acid transporter